MQHSEAVMEHSQPSIEIPPNMEQNSEAVMEHSQASCGIPPNIEQNNEPVMEHSQASSEIPPNMQQNSEPVMEYSQASSDIPPSMEQNGEPEIDLSQPHAEIPPNMEQKGNSVMELSQPCQKALQNLLSKFCLEKLTFDLQVNVSASLTFQLDGGDKYQLITEDVVTKDAAVDRYKQLYVDQEVQATSAEFGLRPRSIQYLPSASSDPADPVAVKIEVNTEMEDEIAAAGGLEGVMTMLKNTQKPQTPKRGRGRPRKSERASCPLCPLTFENKEMVEAHLRTLHDVGNSYTCTVCNKELFSTVELMNHINNEHDFSGIAKAAVENTRRTRPRKSAPKKITAAKKKQSTKKEDDSGTEDYEDDFYDEAEIEQTNIEDTDEKDPDGSKQIAKASNKKKGKDGSDDANFKPTGQKKKPAPANCDECGKKYSSRRALRRHVKTVHDKRAFVCEFCGKSFHSKESMYHHKRGIHLGLKVYKCTEPGCDASFNFSHSLRLHKLKHSGSRPHQCSSCGKTYLTGHHLKVHMQANHSMKQYSCSVCGKMFSYSYSLKTHEATHMTRSRVGCDKCDKTFVNAQALKYHISSRHTEQGQFPCPECHKFYKTEFLLKIHMKRHSMDNKRFMCDLCGKWFMYKSALEMHRPIHQDDKGYTCTVCDKSFKTYATLYSHRTVHKEDHPFKCSECGKGFKTKEQCKSHERRHTGEKPFECTICHHRFPDNGGLSKHKKTVHSAVKRFSCSICGKTASRADNLRVHMKVHTKGTNQSELPEILENTNMPTVVPQSFEGEFLKKSGKGKTADSQTVTGRKSGNEPPNSGNTVAYNQSIPNLPTLEPVNHSSGKSKRQSQPLDLQNPSHRMHSPYQQTKPSTVAHARDDDISEESDCLEIALPEPSPNGESPSPMPPQLQASSLVYAPWPSYVYSSGIQSQQNGANGFYQ